MRRGAEKKAAALAAMAAGPAWPSPCVGICTMDGDLCTGCGRTTAEIVAWRDGPEDTHAQAWQALPSRHAQLGLTLRPLPWQLRDLQRFMGASLRRNIGTWTVGVSGASAEFYIPDGERSDVSVDNDAEGNPRISAHFGPHSMQLWTPEKSRPFAIPVAPDSEEISSIIVALPNGRLKTPVLDGLTETEAPTGLDAGNVETHPTRRHFDLGLNAPTARFVVTLPDSELATRLASAADLSAGDLLARFGADLVSAEPVRTVESTGAAISIAGPIPAPHGTTPDGPHTHLTPSAFGDARQLAADVPLSRVYAPTMRLYLRAPMHHTAIQELVDAAG